jgi:predicted acetyltransferase
MAATTSRVQEREKRKAKDALRLVLQRKMKKGMRVICDAAQQDESQICTHISDASGQHASPLLSVTRFVEKSH